MEKMIDIKNNKCKFNNKDILIVIDNDNNTWFKGKDIANILEYKDTDQSLRKNIDKDDKEILENIIPVSQTGMKNYEKNTIFINESGLYSLILSSKKEEAKLFKKWITKEVLPSIRKYGEYKIKKDIIKIYNAGIKHKDNIIKMKDEYIEKLNLTNELAIKALEKRNNEINEIKPKYVPDTINKSLLNMICIINIFKDEYYVVRCQKRNFTYTLNKLKKKFPVLSIVLKLNYNPNSINLYNRIKESLEDEIEFIGNRFRNEKYSKEELIDKIKELIES